jgi:hypothetical protein
VLKKSHISIILFATMMSVLFSGFLHSCSNEKEDSSEAVIAKASDKTLSQSELESLFGPNMTKQDSILIGKGYIESWLKKQVLLENAYKENFGSSDEINKKVEAFREDLISFEYRKKLLYEKLDTNISLKESKEYYTKHPENFELKQNIVRCVFIKMPVALENKNHYWNSFKKADTEQLTQIAMTALKNGGNAFMENEKWLSFDDILKVVPINTYNQENFINNNRIFKIDEPNFIWYINILDFRIKDNVSPFDFVEDNIHQILLNKRKVEILDKIEKEMLAKARKDKKINVYLPFYE